MAFGQAAHDGALTVTAAMSAADVSAAGGGIVKKGERSGPSPTRVQGGNDFVRVVI